MADKYKSTILVQDNNVTEIKKADLDLLKKINEVSADSTSSFITLFNQEGATRVDNLDTLNVGRFFTFTSSAIGAPMYDGTYVGAGYSFINDDGRIVEIVNANRDLGLQWRMYDGTWSQWRTIIDGNNYTTIYSNDFLIAAASNVQDGFITTVIASGTVNQGAVSVDHPGSLRITSSATTNSGAYVLTQSNALCIQNVDYFSAIYSPLSFTATVTTRLGFHNTTTATAPTLGCYWEAVGANCTAKVIGTYGTYTSPATTLVVGTWYQFRVKIVGTIAYFYLYNDAGTILASYVVTIATNTTSILAGFISTKAGTAKTALVDLDLVKLSLVGKNPRWI